MSSIFGLVHLDESPVEVQQAQRAESQLQHRGEIIAQESPWPNVFLSVRRHADDAAIAGFLARPSDVLIFEGPVFAEMDGSLTAEEIMRSPGELAMACVSADGRKATLYRDPVGLRTLYYYWYENLVIFASEIKALIEHPLVPKSPDWLGLAGHCWGEASPATVNDSCFKGIYALAPGHKVEFEQGLEPRTSSYWDFEVCKKPAQSFRSACEEFRHLFLQAVSRRLSGTKTAVSVSGGLDSSAIFCSALYLGLPVHGLSYISASPDCDETIFLNEIEKKYDVIIERFPLNTGEGVATGLAQQLHTVEAPVVDYLWGVTNTLHEKAREAGARQILSGHWGDQVLFCTAYLTDLMKAGDWITAARHLREYDHWTVEGLGKREARRLPVECLKALLPWSLLTRLIQQKKKRRPASEALNWPLSREDDRPKMQKHMRFGSWQARAMYLMVRSKHFLHCLDWSNKAGARNGLVLSFPLLDRDLLQFLIQLPGELQNHNGIPRAIMREALRGIIPDSIADRTWKADFTDTVNVTAQEECAGMISRLENGKLAESPLVQNPLSWRNEIRSLSKRLTSENCEAAWQLYDYLAIDIFLSQIIENQNQRGEWNEQRQDSQTAL